MGLGTTISIENLSPSQVWKKLSENSKSALIDCRTDREWAQIGVPNLASADKDVHLIEWRQAPDMRINPDFATQVDNAFGGNYPDHIYFICRSGARSLEAAAHLQNILSSNNIDCTCVNVAEGFEGDPGPDGQRGTVSGWKFNNLPWQKS